MNKPQELAAQRKAATDALVLRVAQRRSENAGLNYYHPDEVAWLTEQIERHMEERFQSLLVCLDEFAEQVVFGFYENAVPTYVQGYGHATSALQSPLTAEEANGLVSKIQNMVAQLALLRQIVGPCRSFLCSDCNQTMQDCFAAGNKHTRAKDCDAERPCPHDLQVER